MIDPKASDDVILKEARKMFSHGVDHYDKNRAEMHRASRFYHNTRGRGQWEQEDLNYLDKQGRPALCFNMIRPKIDTWVGMYMDGQRKPMVSPRGGEDKMLADILERICASIYDQSDADAADEDVLLSGCVKGEKNLHLDVRPDPSDPAFVEIMFTPVSAHDILWDPGSERADRSDARHVFWDKWLSKGEFKREYPDSKDSFDDLERGIDPSSEHFDSTADQDRADGDFYGKDTDYPGEGPESYYYDRHLKKIRVIHCEYLIPEKKIFAVNLQSGLSEEVTPEMSSIIKEFQEVFDERFLDVEIRELWKDVTYTLEFIGSAILWKSGEHGYQPYDGFSLIPFTCYFDDEDGVPYGMVRNLFDPQTEINKAHSQTLDMLVGQQGAGVMAEQGAIDDPDEFEEQIHSTGSVAYVADGALSGGRVQERKLPEVSQAVEQRLERGVTMVDRISTVHTDLADPAAQQEAATTVQIRYHKSRLSMASVINNHERFARNVKGKVLQAITRVMTDEQLTALLGDDERFMVQDGVVQEIQLDPNSGEPAPSGPPIPLSDVRLLQHDIKLETSSENSTLRLMELGGLIQLLQAGAPVDPLMLAEKTVTSTADKDQLRKYAREQQAMQMQQSQRQEEQLAQQVQETLGIERSRVEEESRSNRVDEALETKKLADRRMLSLMELWEKADEHEKMVILERMKSSNERQKAREGNQTQMAMAAMKGQAGGNSGGG